MKMLYRLVRESFSHFYEDDCMSSGAAIAFYMVFSLPPLFLIVFVVAGIFGVSPDRLDRLVQGQAGLPLLRSLQQDSEGQKSQQAVDLGQARAAAGRAAPVQGIFGQGIGLVILLFSATAVMAQLQYSLNRAWEVEPDPEQGGVKRFLLKRVLSLAMILVVAFLLLTSLVVTTLIDAIMYYLQGVAPGALVQATTRLLNEAATFVLAGLLFAGMFKFLPDVEIMKWRDVSIGAAVTSLLFVIGKSVISWYLQNAGIAGGWDSAAGSVVAVLVWVYYSSLIVLFGAEVTQVWSNQFGAGARPESGAVRTVRAKEHHRD